jgi:transcriptional regulator with XRE-family HTH domain
MSKKRTICKRLKGLLAENELTISNLAKKIGISENALSLKINGYREWWFWEVMLVTKEFGAENAKEVFPELYAELLKKGA